MGSAQVGKEQAIFAPAGDEHALRQLLQSARGLRYGSLEIIVHDGRIVQIERREKLRVDVPAHRSRIG